MKNLEIAQILNNIADILELEEVQFKPRAYRNAARAIESLSEDIKNIYNRGELESIPGVGKHIAKKIKEIIETGKLKYYQQLKKKTKVDIEELHRIPGLGPKKIKFLYKKLKIKNVKDLEKAIKQKKIVKLKGFGEETEQNIIEGIKFIKTKPKRFIYAHLQPIVDEIRNEFRKLTGVINVEVAGSYRRGKETIGDLDFLVTSSNPSKVIETFVSLPDIKKVISQGTTRSSIRLKNGLQIDLRVVKERELGSALMYFIGNKQHNIELRKIALSKGYTLSEYGLFKLKSKKWIAGRSEEEIYKKLGMQFIPPELRENNGEIKVALEGKLPKLIINKNVKGLFHNHSTWSDGTKTILEMAQKAEQLGMKFISFNDHFGDITIANPLNEKRLVSYLKEIEKVKKKVGIKIFSGVEIDILKNGSLGLPVKKLKELDVVIASVHMATKMSEEKMTKRVCSALENYPVNILAHPTHRLLNERPELKINLNKVFSVAKNQNVFLEINSSIKRMDLNGENVKTALNHGCKVAISTDAHSFNGLENYPLAVLCARRGWANKKDVLNCWSLPRIEKALQK